MKSVYFDDECYVYIGSASKYGRDLSSKKLELLSTWPCSRTRAPRPEIKDLGLGPKGQLITLFEVPFRDNSDEEVMRIRSLVTLARAIFAIWLGAVRELANPEIKRLVPWELEGLHYHGLTGYNPLARNISDPEETRKKREKFRE